MNIMVIGAHPVDCEYFAAGTVVKFKNNGHKVKFVSVSNGDAGTQSMERDKIAKIRSAEMEQADTLLGVEFEILDNHDTEIIPSLEIRDSLIRLIRNFQADMVLSHRPNDFHPDHRNTGILVQDTAYLVIVPNVCHDTPALRKNPIYMYFQDNFKTPVPFKPDIIVPVDDVFDRKVDALHCMSSQFYEFLPWTTGTLDSVPEEDSERRIWLDGLLRNWRKNPFNAETNKIYGRKTAQKIEMIEAFQLCEYGSQPSIAELHSIFPDLPERVG